MVGLELVADRRDPRAVPARRRGSPRPSCALARERGLLLYSGTGNANGVDGDLVLLGPPFVITDEELQTLVATLGDALDAAVAEVTEIAIRPVG